MPPETQTTTPRRTGIRRLFRLARKELVEILRDRRTIITLVLMPLLLYPLLGITIQKFLLNSLNPPSPSAFRIGIDNQESFDEFSALIVRGSYLIDPPIESGDGQEEQPSEKPAPESADPAKLLEGDDESEMPEFFLASADDEKTLEQLLTDDTIDLAVVTKRDAFNALSYELILRENSVASRRAAKWITDRFTAVNIDAAKRVLVRSRRRLPAEFSERSIETENDSAPQTPSLLTFIPLMLVLMTMTGAVYPAIDLTAGERERGTMEILVAAPVSRMALLFGKFVAVLTVAMLTAFVNLLAMTVTLYGLGLQSVIFGENGFPISVILTMLGLLLVFAGFFSATLLGLTSFARSFKEAQAYLIPLMLVSFAPGMLSLAPNVVLSPMLAIVPLVNIVLLARDLLAGTASMPLLAISVFSTVFYGFLALGIAARIFGTDSMLSGGGSSWSDFFRKPAVPKLRPDISTAMFFLAILFPSFIVIGGLAGQIGSSVSAKLVMNAVVTFGLFVLLPILFTFVFRLRFRSSFLLHAPTVLGLLAAFLLGISVWTMAYELEVYSLSKSRIDEMIKLFEETLKVNFANIGLPLKLVCLAMVPAVCEELTFRGFLMSAFRKRVPAVWAVLITAVLFGLFHVFVRDMLLFERMLPTTLMGILLGFVCVRTGSVIPGMLLHVLHNGLLLTISHYESSLASAGIGMSEQTHLPILWIGSAVIPIVLGLVLLIVHPRPRDF